MSGTEMFLDGAFGKSGWYWEATSKMKSHDKHLRVSSTGFRVRILETRGPFWASQIQNLIENIGLSTYSKSLGFFRTKGFLKMERLSSGTLIAIVILLRVT